MFACHLIDPTYGYCQELKLKNVTLVKSTLQNVTLVKSTLAKVKLIQKKKFNENYKKNYYGAVNEQSNLIFFICQ